MEASGLNSSILSPFCDALPEFDCQGSEFPPVEEPTVRVTLTHLLTLMLYFRPWS